jgi:hypothetical protein
MNKINSFFMKKIILIISLFLITITNGMSQELNDSFLSKKQVCKLFDDMILEIETLDAEGIEVRNTTKDVNWNTYKKFHRKKFKKVKSYYELKQKFEAFGAGFVCGHSDFNFLYPVKKEKTSPQ